MHEDNQTNTQASRARDVTYHPFPARELRGYASPAHIALTLGYYLPSELCAVIGNIYHSLCEIFAISASHFEIVATPRTVYRYRYRDGGFEGPKILESLQTKHPYDPNPIGRILAMTAGRNHVIVSATEGLFGYGCNNSGELGLPRSVYRTNHLERIFGPVDAISCGDNHTVILTRGEVYGCGCDAWGQLGGYSSDTVYGFRRIKIADGDIAATAISCGDRFTMVLTVTGSVYIFGNHGSRESHVFEDVHGTAIYAGTSAHIKNAAGWMTIKYVSYDWTITGNNPDWNTPHGKYNVPTATLRALHKERSYLPVNPPNGVGTIATTFHAGNETVAGTLIVAGNGGVFVKFTGAGWIQL